MVKNLLKIIGLIILILLILFFWKYKRNQNIPNQKVVELNMWGNPLHWEDRDQSIIDWDTTKTPSWKKAYETKSNNIKRSGRIIIQRRS